MHAYNLGTRNAPRTSGILCMLLYFIKVFYLCWPRSLALFSMIFVGSLFGVVAGQSAVVVFSAEDVHVSFSVHDMF